MVNQNLSFEGMAQKILISRVFIYIKIRWFLLITLLVSGLAAEYYTFGLTERFAQALWLAAIGLGVNALFFGLATLAKRHTSRLQFELIWLSQLLLDVFLFAGAIYISGGITSPAVILFAIPIIISSSLQLRWRVYLTAVLCAAFYASAITLYQINHVGGLSDALLAQGLFYGLLFFIIAYLSDLLYQLKSVDEADRAQTEMVSLASHQLRTPATAVKGFLAFLIDGALGELNPKQKEFLIQAYSENELELELIDDILNLARLELNSLDFNPRATDLNQLITDVINEHEGNITKRRQEVKFQQPPAMIVAMVDPALMRIVLDNLVSNASKYSGQDGRITIRLKETSEAIQISVEDNGVGISKKDQKRLFKRFSRVNPPGQAYQGAGLGLYLARRIVDMHYGKIWVVSYPNEGSIFSIELAKSDKKLNG